MKKWMIKIKSQAGESIGEVLIALLISSLALVMLAGMISATNNMVKKSDSAMNEYYAGNKDLESQPVTPTDPNIVSITSGSVSITGAGLNSGSISVNVYENRSLGDRVYAYTKSAAPSSTP